MFFENDSDIMIYLLGRMSHWWVGVVGCYVGPRAAAAGIGW